MSPEPNNISESKPNSSTRILKKLLLVLLVGFCAWCYQAAVPPPPRTPGSPDAPAITSQRLKLRDGRHLAYEESGVPKDTAKSKLIFVHGFGSSKFYHPFTAVASPDLIKELGVYIVAIDRPGYADSDPDPKRTVKSLASDIEDLADQLNLGPKFYVVGYSMGGQVIWSCLKYISHRLAGAVLIAPAVNYWWHNLPSNLSNEAFYRQLKQDQWSLRVAHHLPWLTYWWNTQTWFPCFSLIHGNPEILSEPDKKLYSKVFTPTDPLQLQKIIELPTQQGKFESLHRDLNIGFGKWEFDPIDLENPFPNNDGSVHLWMGNEDLIVPVTVQRYIAQQLPWIKYHEVIGAGHTIAYADGVIDDVLKTLLSSKN